MGEANDGNISLNTTNTTNNPYTVDYFPTSTIIVVDTTDYDDDDDGAANSIDNNNSHNSTSQSYLTETQETVLAFLPIFSALLSIVGSMIIIRLIIRWKFRKPYRRILFGMSCYDILNSITVTLQTFLVPTDTSRRLYAIGSTATCQMLGFLFQFSYPSFCYFGVLSIYYVLVVKWNVTDVYFARYIEPLLHTITLLWPTITACLGLHLGLYGEVSIGAGCWISEQPTSSDSICQQQQQQQQQQQSTDDDMNHMLECVEQWTWIMGGLPFMIVFAIVLVNNLLIYCHVRTTIFRVTRQRRKRQQQGQGSSSSTTTGLSSSLNNNSNNGPSSASSSSPQRCASMSPESQEAKVKAVGTQALLYCGVFVLTYCWTIILRLASNSGDGPPQEPYLFPIMVLRAIFLPAMGLGTVLVYTRPRYIMLRKIPVYQQRGRWWTIRQVLWDDDDLLLTGNNNNNTNAGAGSGSGSSSSRTNGNQVNGGTSSSSAFFMLGGGNSLRSLLLRMPSTTNIISRSGRFETNTSSVFGFSAASGRESNDYVLPLSPIDEEVEDDKKKEGSVFAKDVTTVVCHGHTIQQDKEEEEEKEEQTSGTLSHPGFGEEEEGVVGVLGVGKARGREEGEQEVGNLAIADEEIDLAEEMTEYEVATKGQ